MHVKSLKKEQDFKASFKKTELELYVFVDDFVLSSTSVVFVTLSFLLQKFALLFLICSFICFSGFSERFFVV